MKLHIGSEIRRVMQEKGITPEWLAQQISTSRRNLYDILNREEISTSQLQDFSQALDYDFFALYQKASNTTVNEPLEQYGNRAITRHATLSVVIELDGLQTTLDQWVERLQKINAAL